MKERILVIRLSALGDLVLCFQSFASIRSAHPQAHIALLTMPAFADFARQMPWFDEVLIDPRPKMTDLCGWRELLGKIMHLAPTRVYDLQGKFRQTILYAALGGPLSGVEWSGAAPLCSHPRLWPPEPGMHFTDFIAAQLKCAGIEGGAKVDVSWLDAPLEKFNLPARYAVLIPGCAPTRLYKRWPAAQYAALADQLMKKGVSSYAVGTKADSASIAEICALTSNVTDLSGKTSLNEVASLARHGVCAVGNDTGPTHLAAAVGGRTLTLMAEQVNPVWAGPKGPQAQVRQGHPLGALSVEDVYALIEKYL